MFAGMKFRWPDTIVLIGILGIVWLWRLPPDSELVNGVFLFSVICVWSGIWMRVWESLFGRVVWGLLGAAAVAPFLLAAKEMDRERLRKDYVARMVAFEGVPHLWGGEGTRGIDCSGLPRRALWEEGVRNFNGTAFRAFAEQWWFDARARELRDGYRGYVRPLKISGTIRAMDTTRLQPGDLAFTRSGNHIIAYVGDGKWIQADPGRQIVAMETPMASDSRWFDTKVTLHRWREL